MHFLCNLCQDVLCKPKCNLARLADNGCVLEITTSYFLHISLHSHTLVDSMLDTAIQKIEEKDETHNKVQSNTPPPHHNRFMALFPGQPGWASARRELLDFMVQWKIIRGRHTDHPAGRHCIRTNQCPPPPSPIFSTGHMPFLSPNWRQYRSNTFRETHDRNRMNT